MSAINNHDFEMLQLRTGAQLAYFRTRIQKIKKRIRKPLKGYEKQLKSEKNALKALEKSISKGVRYCSKDRRYQFRVEKRKDQLQTELELKKISKVSIAKLLKRIRMVEKDIKDVERFQRVLSKQSDALELQFQQRLNSAAFNHQQQGLTLTRINQFHQFLADQSLAGEKCGVCQEDVEDLEVGRRMMRLDCRHVFCRECIEQWLADNNTCPHCRHVFQ